MTKEQWVQWDSYFGRGSVAAVDRFEELSGVRLPLKYREIVVANEGAFPVSDVVVRYVAGSAGHEREVGLSMLMPFRWVKSAGDLPRMFKLLEFPPEGFPSGLVAFGETGGGDFFCFDYRGSQVGEPAVCIWHHGHADADARSVVRLADSFTEFLQGLKPCED